MKKHLPLLFSLVLLLGCKEEADLDVAADDTFIRYFGSENNHTPVLAEEAHGGYTMLSTVEIQIDNFGNFLNQIQLTHVDQNGNLVWRQKYPDDATMLPFFNAKNQFGGFVASSFIAINSGYLILGDSIKQDQQNPDSRMLLLETDLSGNVVRQKSFSVPEGLLHGKAVTMNAAGDSYLVLGKIGNDQDSPAEDMYLTKLSPTFSKIWEQKYGQGKSQLTSRIYSDGANNILWGSTVEISETKRNIRMILTKEDNSITDYNNFVGTDDNDELIADFFKEGNAYALVGSVNPDITDNDNDIYFARITVSNDKTVTLAESSYLLRNAAGEDLNLDERGVSICQAQGGGYIILANIESGNIGKGLTDFYLMNVDAAGNVKWTKNYGTVDEELSASVRPTSDGGYLLFGSSGAALKKAVLMKLNKDGNI